MLFLLQARPTFYHAYGIFGVILGLIVIGIVLWCAWGIFNVLQSKFGTGEMAWFFQILRYLLIAMMAIWLLGIIAGYFPYPW